MAKVSDFPAVSVDKIDRNSLSWKAVEDFCHAEIAKLQDRLSLRGLDPVETEFLRGQIDALRSVAALTEDDRLPPEAFSDPYRGH